MTRRSPEDDLQRACLQYLLLAVPSDAGVWFHVPNGGLRAKRTAAHFKALGVLPGVADLVFSLPGGRVGYVELKAKRGVTSDTQRAFRARVEALGAPYFIVRTLDEFIAAVDAMGLPSKVRAAA